MISFIALALTKGLFKNRFTTAISAVALVAVALFAWHKIDKGSAVRKAVSEYVAASELHALRYQVDEANRRSKVAAEAQVRLADKVADAAVEKAALEVEIERYEDENEINPDGVLDEPFYNRLRNK